MKIILSLLMLVASIATVSSQTMVMSNGKQNWFFERRGTNEVSFYMYPNIKGSFSPRQTFDQSGYEHFRVSLLEEGFSENFIENTRFYVRMNPPTYYYCEPVVQPTTVGPYEPWLLEALQNATPHNGQFYHSGKTVHVNGYARKDGTYVHSYYRRPPSK